MRVGNLFSHLQFSNSYQSQHIPQDLVIYLCQQECCVINLFFFLAKQLNIPHPHPRAPHTYKLNLSVFLVFCKFSLPTEKCHHTDLLEKESDHNRGQCLLAQKTQRKEVQDKRHINHFFCSGYRYSRVDLLDPI